MPSASHCAADDYSTRSLLSEVGKWMVPTWGGIIILYEIQVELAQLKTTPRKPLIKAGHLAQSGFIWWGLLQHAKKSQDNIDIFIQRLQNTEDRVCKNYGCLATALQQHHLFYLAQIKFLCWVKVIEGMERWSSLTAMSKCSGSSNQKLIFNLLWSASKLKRSGRASWLKNHW